MNSEEREVIHRRVRDLYAKLRGERKDATPDQGVIHRLEGNIGALEWVLREFPDERHASGCICADCAGAVMDARND